jgi:hypothetical protein
MLILSTNLKYNRIYKLMQVSDWQSLKMREKFSQVFYYEMTKITISNQSCKSKRKYKSENGRTWTSEYIRGGIRCHGGVSIPC